MMFPSNVVYLDNSTLHIFPGCDVRQENNIKIVFLAKISTKKNNQKRVKYQFEVSNCTTSYLKRNAAIKLQQKRSNGL